MMVLDGIKHASIITRERRRERNREVFFINGQYIPKTNCMHRIKNILKWEERDLFQVYFNICEFHFVQLHINKTNSFCFFIHNGHVPGNAK